MKPSGAMKILKPLWSAFTRTAPPNEAMVTYSEYLCDLSPDVLQNAIQELIMTAKFFPVVAEIRATAARQQRDDLPGAEDAWLEVNRAVRAYGHYGQPVPGGGYTGVKFSHPAIQRAVDVIGWDRICEGENDAMDFAQFRNTFNSYRERELRAVQLGPLLSALLPTLLPEPRTMELMEEDEHFE